MTLYTQVAANRRKTWAFLLLYVLIILGLGYFIAWFFGAPDILFFAGVLAIVQGLISFQFSDSIALAVAQAKELPQEQFPQVYKIMQNLTITAGLPMPRLYYINDSALNAFATGKDAKHAAIAMTTGLLDQLDDNELSGVLAHELSHIGNEDIKLTSMVMIMAGLIALLSDLFWRNMLWGRGRSRDDNGSNNGVFLIVGLALTILAPLAATLIQLAISRKREFMADANAVLLTRYPEGMIAALRKISGDTEPLEVANKATAHMYFANPLHKGVLLANLFSTHPPIEERIKALEQGSGIHS